MGYKFENILAKYEELIDFVKEKEAAADIILLGNLHVTQSRSQSDEVFNNAAINRLNQALSKLAKKKKIAYFDANVLFDDENGALAQDSPLMIHTFMRNIMKNGESGSRNKQHYY